MADLQDSLPEGLAEYVLTEVRRNGMVRLPDEGPRDMKMTIRAGTRTLLRDPEGRLFEGEGMRATANPRKYFGAFLMPSNANTIPALQLDVENTSRLYTTSASIQLVGVFVDTHSEETEIVRKICRDFIMLSYL
jgi:hypothetical protein